MRLHVLNKHPSSPCIILKYKDLTVLLDCHLDLSTLLHFLPCPSINSTKLDNLKHWASLEVKQQIGTETNLVETAGRLFIDSVPEICTPEDGLVDYASIDVILLTNYCNVLALPFITEYSGFNGKILATEPTLQLGRLYMEELVAYSDSIQKKKKNTQWKKKNVLRFLPYPLCEFHDSIRWQTIYSAHDVANCISKIQTVGFSEKLDILGLIEVIPVSSGFTIGSTNWVLQTSYHKISYISSSSMFATHAMPMQQNMLKDADVCILNSLTESPTANPDAMLRELCSHLAVTIKNGGNVLIPCFPSGVIYDLFEYLCSFMDGSGLSFTPIYFISPVAHSSLEYANIYAEWLNQNKQAKVYLPEPPFIHHELVKNGRVVHYPNLHEGFSNSFKSPCIVFTGHPSLRFGDALHFINLWGQSSSNTVLFIDSQFPYLDALTPFQPLAMKAAYCPIDPRLNFQQATKLLKEIKPKKLIIPEAYTKAPVTMSQRTDLIISADCPVETYRHLDIIDVPFNKSYAKVHLSPKLAQTLSPKQLEAGVAVASVKGKLVTRDNKHTLMLPDDQQLDPKNCSSQFFGDVNIKQFMQALKEHGISNVEVETTESGHIVHFSDIDSMIQLEAGNTHIINHSNDKLRVQIKAALLSCLLKVDT